MISSTIIFCFNIFWIKGHVSYSSNKYIIISLTVGFVVCGLINVVNNGISRVIANLILAGYYRGASYSMLALISKRLGEHCKESRIVDPSNILYKFHSALKVLSSGLGVCVLTFLIFGGLDIMPMMLLCALMYGCLLVMTVCEKKEDMILPQNN